MAQGQDLGGGPSQASPHKPPQDYAQELSNKTFCPLEAQDAHYLFVNTARLLRSRIKTFGSRILGNHRRCIGKTVRLLFRTTTATPMLRSKRSQAWGASIGVKSPLCPTLVEFLDLGESSAVHQQNFSSLVPDI